jgi:hypothetical protein
MALKFMAKELFAKGKVKKYLMIDEKFDDNYIKKVKEQEHRKDLRIKTCATTAAGKDIGIFFFQKNYF